MKSQSILNRPDQIQSIAYWIFTLPIAFENAAGAMWVLMRIEYPRLVLAHLGYPQYIQYILGPWELACAAALVAPRLARAKEWAYAGAFLKYSSACISFLLAGSFDVQEGDLVIRGDATATAVRMHVAIDRYWLFRLGETDILKRLIKVTGEGTPEVKIVTNIEPSWRNYGRAEYPIDFEIVVPAGAALKIADTSGKIEISGINSDVVVHDESGTLAVRNVKGPLDIDKKSGDVRVQDVSGAINVASASGQLQFQRVGELNVSSSDGNLTVTDAGSVRLVNKGGNIRISGIRGSVHIDDDSGEIEVSQVSGDVSIRDTSGQIRVSQVGALTVNDTSGDVVVDGARGVNVESKQSGQVKLRNVAGDAKVPPGITLSRR